MTFFPKRLGNRGPYDDFIGNWHVFGAFLSATAEFTSVSLSKDYLSFLKSGYLERKFTTNIEKLEKLAEMWRLAFGNGSADSLTSQDGSEHQIDLNEDTKNGICWQKSFYGSMAVESKV
jgi:hypothetical protein